MVRLMVVDDHPMWRDAVERDLQAAGHDVVDLSDIPRRERARAIGETKAAMNSGVARIVQAALASTDGKWFGYADVLRRVDTPSPNLGDWSYEAIDCGIEELPTVLADRADWAGFSCTMPLKRAALDLAVEVAPMAAAAQGRLGVTQSIRGRVTDLGGTVRIMSSPDAGTEIELTVPRTQR
jgi:hypothetical protein